MPLTLNFKNIFFILYSCISPSYCVRVWFSKDIKFHSTENIIRACFATDEKTHSRDNFVNKKIKPLDRLIKHPEGILKYMIINAAHTYTSNFLTHGDVGHI